MIVELENKVLDVIHGIWLSKYINDIQLLRKEYAITDISSKDHFHCRRHITDPEAIRLAREREENPNILSGKDRVYAFYKMMGMEIDYDEFLKSKLV